MVHPWPRWLVYPQSAVVVDSWGWDVFPALFIMPSTRVS